MKNRICYKCKLEKKIKEFGKDKSRKDNYKVWCKNCWAEFHKEYNKKNREKISKRAKEYREQNKFKISKRMRKYYQQNKKRILKRTKIYKRNRRRKDINFDLLDRLRNRIYITLKGKRKSKYTLELLGCSIEKLKKHLQKQFQKGMSWNNHGRTGWHIDHIKPCATFDLSKSKEQKKCFHYSNLRPLWAKDNLRRRKEVKR